MEEKWDGMPMKGNKLNEIVIIKKIRLRTYHGLYLDCDSYNGLGLFERDEEDEPDYVPKSAEWKVLWRGEGDKCKLMSSYGTVLTFRGSGPGGWFSTFFLYGYVSLEPWPVPGNVADWHLEILNESSKSSKLFLAKLRPVADASRYFEFSGYGLEMCSNILAGIRALPGWTVEVVEGGDAVLNKNNRDCSQQVLQQCQHTDVTMPRFVGQMIFNNMVNKGNGTQTLGGDSYNSGHNVNNSGKQKSGGVQVVKDK